jgi:hypothetical protein
METKPPPGIGGGFLFGARLADTRVCLLETDLVLSGYNARGELHEGSAMSRVRSGSGLALQGVIAVALALLAIVAPGALAAEGERQLDPRLSLIGGCKAEALDPIEDPGCPTTTPPSSAHPPSPFSDPRSVATDFYGNIYVSNFGADASGSQGRVDIFSPDGVFISEFKTIGPTSLAIDSKGNLYVAAQLSGEIAILRFAPDPPYQPAAGTVQYTTPPVPLALAGPECPDFNCSNRSSAITVGLAINAEDDHLFANFGGTGIVEYTSAEEGNEEVRSIFGSEGANPGIAVDDVRDLLYASVDRIRIDIFDLNSVIGTPPNDEYEKIGTIDGSDTPAKKFGSRLSVAVDEGTGHVFVFDNEFTRLYEFDENGNYLTTIEFPFQKVEAGQIGVDNGPFSPNGKLGDGAKGRYLYVPSHRTGTGHSFAFFESNVGPPLVVSTATANITEDEAELRARINPGNAPTAYTFEIEAEGAGGWTLVRQGTIPAGNLDAEATAVAAGLTSGTRYRFRVVATNEAGSDEAEGSFGTYPTLAVETTPCPNALLRTGPSALLPDCRAYELVTPPDTNGRAPIGTSREPGAFATRQVSPAGGIVPFKVEGGALPGDGGTGSLLGDPYVSSRAPSGWTTAYIGPSAAEAGVIVPGTTSPDQRHSFWMATGNVGPAVIGGNTSYVRYPDGHSELVGQGSLGIDPKALGLLISDGGGHIIFATGSGASTDTAVQLEPQAAPPIIEEQEVEGEMKEVKKGTAAIYDRTPDGTTHVVSLKPGDIPFGAGEHALFMGASLDGEGVAFEVKGTLYLRYDSAATFAIGTGVEFAGFPEDGRRLFYVEDGDLKRFEVGSGVSEFSTSGDVTPVQVSADGTAAYFVSPSVLTAVAGPNGAKAQAGKQNLYVSKEGQISFVGVVTDRDVEGEPGPSETVDGLGLWVIAAQAPYAGRFGLVPARTTPDGSVLLFKSRAALGDYDPEGHAQIYRYDSPAGELQCLSCNPTGAAASSDATLQSESREGSALFHALAWLENLRADGRRAFFESSEPLVARDSDGLQDVYEWEDQGAGSCTVPGGCLYLISSGQSLRDDYLWAVSKSGDDVFFLSSDRLVGADADETPSIYDARVGGGFPEPVPTVCEGEGCWRPHPQPPPPHPVNTPVLGPGDHFKLRRCGKGKRKVKRAGKVRCVKKKQRHRRAGANLKEARR